jgi:hypothetical protein
MHRKKLLGALSAAAIAAVLVFSLASSAVASHPTQTAKPSVSAAYATPVGAVAPTKSLAKKKTVYVYITDTGHKYHRSGCRYLRYSKHKVKLSTAKRMGEKPCKVCKPPR